MIHIITKTTKVNHSSVQLEIFLANTDLSTISSCRGHWHFSLHSIIVSHCKSY